MQTYEQDFIQAYIATALWSTNDESTPSGGHPLDDNYGPSDISDETVAQMTKDCLAFLAKAAQLIEDDNPTLSGDGTGAFSHAGHDFWLTRNGHGAGFWDGDWPTNGDKLDELSKTFGEYTLYVGDDGLIYS